MFGLVQISPDHVRNIFKTCFIQIHDLRRVRQHLTDEAATLSSGVCLVSTCANYSVFKTHLLGLSQTVTNTILKRLYWLQLNFAVSSKLQVSSQWSSQLLWSSFVYSFGRYSTRYNHPDKRFLNSVHLYINQKNSLATALLLMFPWFGIICLMRSLLPQL